MEFKMQSAANRFIPISPNASTATTSYLISTKTTTNTATTDAKATTTTITPTSSNLIKNDQRYLVSQIHKNHNNNNNNSNKNINCNKIGEQLSHLTTTSKSIAQSVPVAAAINKKNITITTNLIRLPPALAYIKQNPTNIMATNGQIAGPTQMLNRLNKTTSSNVPIAMSKVSPINRHFPTSIASSTASPLSSSAPNGSSTIIDTTNVISAPPRPTKHETINNCAMTKELIEQIVLGNVRNRSPKINSTNPDMTQKQRNQLQPPKPEQRKNPYEQETKPLPTMRTLPTSTTITTATATTTTGASRTTPISILKENKPNESTSTTISKSSSTLATTTGEHSIANAATRQIIENIELFENFDMATVTLPPGTKLIQKLPQTKPKTNQIVQKTNVLSPKRTSMEQSECSSPRLQRSKSLSTAAINNVETAERRHSVAIMAKDLPPDIETITIQDDDEDDIMELLHTDCSVSNNPSNLSSNSNPLGDIEYLEHEYIDENKSDICIRDGISESSNGYIQNQIIKNETNSQYKIEPKTKCINEIINENEITPTPTRTTTPTPTPTPSPTPTPTPTATPTTTPKLIDIKTEHNLNIVKAETLQLSKEDFEKTLLCEEKVLNSTTSSSSSCSILSSGGSNRSLSTASTTPSQKPPIGTLTLASFARIGNDIQNAAAKLPTGRTYPTSASTRQSSIMHKNIKIEGNTPAATTTSVSSLNSNSGTSSYSNMLHMLSTFNMLSWKERVGSARDTHIRFALNEYNLLQIYERCPPRKGAASFYVNPIVERQQSNANRFRDAAANQYMYLCAHCSCHGPATEFLAPKYCSLVCLRRSSAKQQILPIIIRDESKKQQQYQQQQHQQHRQMLNKSNRKIDNDNDVCTPVSLVRAARKPFLWSEYLNGKSTGFAAPIHLFLNPFPFGPNFFQRGMKLEAIDPENCSLFCVCTIIEVRGYRLKLCFDGYQRMYDFWVNADSLDIFPPGWCEKTNRVLQPPKGHDPKRFSWSRYLIKTKYDAAPRELFTHLNSTTQQTQNHFKVGMHLEAEDLNDTGKICVATVADVLDERIRVHFDGWDDCYDLWVHINSPYIHPCGWHEGRQQLIVPPDYQNTVFRWSDYIRQVGRNGDGRNIAANPDFFSARDPMDFRPDMQLEVVDPRNPSLIRPATVINRKGYRIQLHLDCWPSDYYFWLEDDSPDLHPIGWCEATAHDLEPPPGFQMRQAQMPCDIEGCRGIGNAKRFHLNVHAMRDCCPYAPENWRTKNVKPARVSSEDIVRETLPIPQVYPKHQLSAEPSEKPIEQSVATNFAVSSQAPVHPPPLVYIPQLVETQKQYQLDQQRKQQRLERKKSAGTLSSMSDNAPKPNKQPRCSFEQIEVETIVDSRAVRIAKSFLADYGPRLEQNFNLWQQNIDFDLRTIKRNPLYWNTMEAAAFVERILNCSNTAQLIRHEDVDGKALLTLCQNDLVDILGLKLGPAVKLFSHILQLRLLVVSKFRKASASACSSTRSEFLQHINDYISADADDMGADNRRVGPK